MYAEPVEELFIHIEVRPLVPRITLSIEMEGLREKASNTFKELVTCLDVRSIKNGSHNFHRNAPEAVAESLKNWIDNQVG